MRRILSVVCVFIVCFCVGCSWLRPKHAKIPRQHKFVKSGKILKKDRLSKGGKLLLRPFIAGSNVVSSDFTDTISLWIIKGIYDILGQGDSERIYDVYGIDEDFFDDDSDVIIIDDANNFIKVGKQNRFELFFSENIDYIDLILEGHVTEMKRDFFLKRWLLGSKSIVLVVEGKIIEKTTGRFVLYFEHRLKSKDGKLDFKNLGRLIGQDIAKFILSGIG